jgi:hypothetical protein
LVGRPSIPPDRLPRALLRTTRHAGDLEIQHDRKCVEQVFGRMKAVGLMRKTRRRRQPEVSPAAACDLVRIRNPCAI